MTQARSARRERTRSRSGTPMPGTRCSLGTGGCAKARSTSLRAGDATIVFCEVKTRRGDAFGTPAEAVTPRKQGRLRTLAVRWLSDNKGADVLRFDVASVKPDGRGAWIVDVLEAAF